MAKYKIRTKARYQRSSPYINRAIIVVVLAGLIGASGRLAAKSATPAASPALQTNEPSLTRPSKEYIYAGGRLIASEEPNHTTTIGVYNPDTATFYLRNSNTPGPEDLNANFGVMNMGWDAIAGDWDGNGTTTLGVYDPSDRIFYLRNTNSAGFADLTINYGPPGAKPVVGDWDGDGTTTIGVYVLGTPPLGTGTFYLRNSNTIGFADISVVFGDNDWVPIAGDWDGNGTTTIGAYDPGTAPSNTGTFYLRNANTVGFADSIVSFGGLGWKPVVGNWDGL